MIVEFVPIDKEQPELPFNRLEMGALPFPGEEVVLNHSSVKSDTEPPFEVRVIRRQFLADTAVRLFVRVLPPQGDR
jgi:hypothetical protein